MIRRAAVVAGATLIAVLAGAHLHSRSQMTAARRAAIQKFEMAEASWIAGRGDESANLLFDAFESDPTYLPALAELWRQPALGRLESRWRERRERILRRLADTALTACVDGLAGAAHEVYRPPLERDGDSAAAQCEQFNRLHESTGDPVSTRVELSLALSKKYPRSLIFAERLVFNLAEARDWRRVLATGRDYTAKSPSPLIRALGYAAIVKALRATGPDSAALDADRVAQRELAKHPDAVRLLYEGYVDEIHREPVDLLLHFGDGSARLEYLVIRGNHAYHNGDLAASDRIWTFALSEYGDVPLMRAFALTFRGRTHLKAGRLEAAERDLVDAQRAERPIGWPGLLVQVQHNLFHVYEAMDRRESAIASGLAYVAQAAGAGFRSQRMMAFHDLGWYYWQMGRYDQARSMLGRMLATIDTLGKDRHYAGEYYERLGDLERALHMYELATAEKVDYRSTARRAVLAAQMGDSALAIRLARAHDTADGPNYPEFTPQLPGILAAFGMGATALVAAESAQARARARNQAAAVANLLLERASLEIQTRNYTAARAHADTGAAIARQVAAFETEILATATRELAGALIDGRAAHADSIAALSKRTRQLPQLGAQVNTLLGDARAALHDRSAALAAYARAAASTETMSISLSSDADRAGFRGSSGDVSAKALELIVRNRAPDALERFVAWSIRRKARGVAAARVPRATSLPVPARGEAVIDFVVLKSMTAALVVTSDGTTLHELPVSSTRLAEQVRALREMLTPRLGALIDTARSRFDASLAQTLYREIIGPLMPRLRGVDRLVIVPDGPLHFVPFDALVVDDDASTEYLVQRFTIRYAPSLDLVNREPGVPEGAVLAVSGDAVSADAEVSVIRRNAAPAFRVVTLDAEGATERRIRALAPAAGVVHFATHAATNDAAPLFAFLALRGDSADDGRLHAFEIERMRFNHSLIVLSGCDTGAGRLAGGEGVLSLSRVFLRAGAAGTVATLWPVGGGTPELMGDFYAELSRGASPATALRRAKLRALSGRFANPLHWAAFVLIAA